MTINEYITTGFAILGGLYTVALAIVKLTPSPSDDAMLATIWSWVQSISGAVLGHPADSAK